jgi:hypothetical protein
MVYSFGMPFTNPQIHYYRISYLYGKFTVETEFRKIDPWWSPAPDNLLQERTAVHGSLDGSRAKAEAG